MSVRVLSLSTVLLCFALLVKTSEHLVSSSSTNSKWVKLQPIRCVGQYTYSSASGTAIKTVPAVYLCRQQLEVLDNSDGDSNSDEDTSINTVTLCDLVPVPLLEDPGEVISVIVKKSKTRDGPLNGLINRDNGLYDKLPYQWRRNGKSKKDFFDYVVANRFKKTQFDTFLAAMDSVFGLTVTGLLIEVADRFSKNSLSLGGAAVVAVTENASNYMLSKVDTPLPTETDEENAQATVVEIPLDEVVGLALILDLPILVPSKLFGQLTVDASITTDDGVMSITGPIRPVVAATLKSGQDQNVPKAWEIYDPKKFLSFNSLEKRAVLRASGVTSLPRPRLGSAALDKALLDLMDDAVRGEVLRLKSVDGENIPAEFSSYQSARQFVLQQIGEAFQRGDTAEAQALRDDFIRMTALRADPTQAEGSYDRYLDQDDWYMEQRKKAMRRK